MPGGQSTWAPVPGGVLRATHIAVLCNVLLVHEQGVAGAATEVVQVPVLILGHGEVLSQEAGMAFRTRERDGTRAKVQRWHNYGISGR